MRRLRGDDRLLVFAVALGVRALAAGGVAVWLAATDRSTLFPDEALYIEEARAVASGDGLHRHWYANLLAALFKVFGEGTAAPRLLNVVAGSLVAVAVVYLAGAVADRASARRAGLLCAIWPSLVVWSVFVLKDSLVALAAVAALAGLARASHGRLAVVLPIVAGLAAMALLRRYGFVLLLYASAAGVASAVAVRRTKQVAAVTAAVVAAGLALSSLGGYGLAATGFVADHATAEVIGGTRAGSRSGDTSFGSDEEVSDIADALDDLPRTLVFTFLGPFPWSPGDPEARALLVVELPVWYAGLAAAAVGLVKGRSRWWPTFVAPLAFAVSSAGVVALYQANAGTAIRQRAMVVPVVAVLAAAAVRAPVATSGSSRPAGAYRSPRASQSSS